MLGRTGSQLTESQMSEICPTFLLMVMKHRHPTDTSTDGQSMALHGTSPATLDLVAHLVKIHSFEKQEIWNT